MSIIDLIKLRKNIAYQESDGLNLATHTINEFKDRTFTLKSIKNRYFGLSSQELLNVIQNELDSMLILYHYTTKTKKYTDRKGISQIVIKVLGNASTMNRYNPLNIEMEITTEA